MSAIEVQTFVLGELQTNCYLVWCSDSRQAVVIDPADSGEFISEQIMGLQLDLQAIILTHAHFDHCLGLLALSLNFPVPVYLHSADIFLLKEAQKSAEHWLKRPVDPVPVETQSLQAGQSLIFGKCSLTVIETPGHTPGSVSLHYKPEHEVASKEQFLYSENNILFSGDTIFKDTIGRTDLRYSNKNELFHSLRKIKELPASTLLYSGHGESGFLYDHPLFAKTDTK